MKCQSLFSRKNKNYTISLSSAEYADRVVKVKYKIGSFSLSKSRLCLVRNGLRDFA